MPSEKVILERELDALVHDRGSALLGRAYQKLAPDNPRQFGQEVDQFVRSARGDFEELFDAYLEARLAEARSALIAQAKKVLAKQGREGLKTLCQGLGDTFDRMKDDLLEQFVRALVERLQDRLPKSLADSKGMSKEMFDEFAEHVAYDVILKGVYDSDPDLLR